MADPKRDPTTGRFLKPAPAEKVAAHVAEVNALHPAEHLITESRESIQYVDVRPGAETKRKAKRDAIDAQGPNPYANQGSAGQQAPYLKAIYDQNQAPDYAGNLTTGYADFPAHLTPKRDPGLFGLPIWSWGALVGIALIVLAFVLLH